MDKVKFIVLGEPKGKGRPRFSTQTGRAFTPKQTVNYEALVHMEYLNATYSLKKAIADIQGKIEKVKTDLQTIDEMCSDYKTNAQDIYLKTLDLSKAMAEEKRLRDLKEKMEADKRAREEAERRRIEQEEARRQELVRRQEEEVKRREAERQAAQERAAAQASQAEPESDNGNTQAVNVFGISDNENGQNVLKNTQSVPENVQDTPAKRYRATFWVEGNLEQIKALREYMIQNGIKFGKAAK